MASVNLEAAKYCSMYIARKSSPVANGGGV